MRKTILNPLLLVLALAAFLAVSCDAEPSADPITPSGAQAETAASAAPGGASAGAESAPTPAQPQAGEDSGSVLSTDSARPDPAQPQAGAAVDPPTPPASGPGPCELVQGDPGPPGQVPLHVEVVAEGLEIPWGLAILPNGDLLVTERPGRVRLIQQGRVVSEPVAEFTVSMPEPLYGLRILGSEGGLLGLLLHPEFASNRKFYLFYNLDREDGVQIGRIERYVLSEDGRSAALERVILDDLPAGLHHQGGRMRIGPDGMLYVGVGAYEPEEAQNPDTLAGKLLRMDLDGQIPPDNPDPDS